MAMRPILNNGQRHASALCFSDRPLYSAVLKVNEQSKPFFLYPGLTHYKPPRAAASQLSKHQAA